MGRPDPKLDLATSEEVWQAKIAAGLNHAGLVTFDGIGMRCNQPYVVMQFIDEETLEELLGADSRLNRGEVWWILKETITALDYVNDNRRLHIA